MTREEAIEYLKRADTTVGQTIKTRTAEALEMAIKALEQEPCEDCISREKVLSEIETVCFSKEWIEFRLDNGSNGERDYIINYIKELPPVQPELFINKPCVSEQACRDDKMKVLDKIRAEIERRGGNDEKAFCKILNESYKLGLREAIEIIDKYMKESDGE